MKHETEKTAEVYAELSTQLSSAAQRMTEFINRQKAEIKPVPYDHYLSFISRQLMC